MTEVPKALDYEEIKRLKEQLQVENRLLQDDIRTHFDVLLPGPRIGFADNRIPAAGL